MSFISRAFSPGLTNPKFAPPPSCPVRLDWTHPLARRLLGFWPLHRDLRDYSPLANSSTAIGSPRVSLGSRGPALSLNGSTDAVSAPFIARYGDPYISGQLTFSAWILPAANTDGEIIACNIKGFEYWSMRFNRGNNNKITYAAKYYAATGNTTTSSLVGKLTHVAITYNSGTVTFYVNGAVDAVVTGASALAAGYSAPLGIGTDPNNGGPYFNGQIFCAGYWSRALTASEIFSLYAAPYALLEEDAPAPTRWFLTQSGPTIVYLTARTASRASGRAAPAPVAPLSAVTSARSAGHAAPSASASLTARTASRSAGSATLSASASLSARTASVTSGRAAISAAAQLVAVSARSMARVSGHATPTLTASLVARTASRSAGRAGLSATTALVAVSQSVTWGRAATVPPVVSILPSRAIGGRPVSRAITGQPILRSITGRP